MLKDMKIIVKTTLLSSILLLFCAIIGVSGFLFTKNSNNNLSSMYNNDLQAIIITDDMLQIEESYNLIKDTVYNFTNMIDSPALNEAKIKESTLDLVKTLDNFRSQANALMKKHLENTDVTYAKT